MVPLVDFDIADSILRVLEGWELGNSGLYKKYWSYIQNTKDLKFYFGPGNPRTMFSIFQIFS